MLSIVMLFNIPTFFRLTIDKAFIPADATNCVPNNFNLKIHERKFLDIGLLKRSNN